MFKEFQDVTLKGSRVDMAIGIVIGARFSSIIKSFVCDMIMPVFGVVTGDH